MYHRVQTWLRLRNRLCLCREHLLHHPMIPTTSHSKHCILNTNPPPCRSTFKRFVEPKSESRSDLGTYDVCRFIRPSCALAFALMPLHTRTKKSGASTAAPHHVKSMFTMPLPEINMVTWCLWPNPSSILHYVTRPFGRHFQG